MNCNHDEFYKVYQYFQAISCQYVKIVAVVAKHHPRKNQENVCFKAFYKTDTVHSNHNMTFSPNHAAPSVKKSASEDIQSLWQLL